MMKLARGYGSNSNPRTITIKGRSTFELNQDSCLVIKIPFSRILGVILKSLFLVTFVIALPLFGSYVNDGNRNEFFPMVFKDLMTEGLVKDGQKGIVLSSGVGDLFDGFWVLNEKGIDVVIDSDLDRRMVVPDVEFDFVFVSSLENAEFVNRVVKVDGIVVMVFGKCYDRFYEFLELSNYKIVYLRQFDLATVVAMRKIDGEGEEGVFSG